MTAGIPLDGQFLVVTAAALWGLWVLLRPFLPRRRKEQEEAGGGAACPRCSASGSCASAAAKAGGSGLVTLGSRHPGDPGSPGPR